MLSLVKNNLALRQNQDKYFGENEEVIDINIIAALGYSTEVKVVLNTLKPDDAAKKLIDYLSAVSEITVKELNEFVLGLGNTAVITKEMLYTVDTPPPSQASLVKPKKALIVAVGIVLGGMLGVFAALIRSMIRKRKNAA